MLRLYQQLPRESSAHVLPSVQMANSSSAPLSIVCLNKINILKLLEKINKLSKSLLEIANEIS